jgi:hypothetical protein
MKPVTLDDLRKTKVGQLPGNKKLLEEAISRHGAGTSVLAVDLLAGPKPQQKPPSRPLVGELPSDKKMQGRLVLCVTIIRFGHRELDEDNFVAGAKPIRDCIAASLGVDDADKRIQWAYRQVIGAGRVGTLVKIDRFV